ncbi:integrase [Bifidobacterium ramosum]|uniref:Integrase n=1 Tax=Bifidobacterium ramosum TaxID=1798158 RepID=A0A6L4X460_9BIFI|nr:site-specific integrase [Bifidobacterium ramosum]KAB8289353.1 integrase [Bifidobacterium ramosum]NEG71050.1 tyrosine-type recombinase/integrase [Bifidobacterium ramosum]
MANVTRYQTVNGIRYRVRYRKPDGTQTDKRGFKRKIDAETWAAEHVTIAKAAGSYVDPEAGKRFIGDLHEQWTAEKRPFWKPVSTANMDNAWTIHCEAKWADRRVGDITRAEVQAWIGRIVETAGAPSVSRPYQILNGICQIAVRDKLIARNPCEGIELPRLPSRKERRVYLTIPRLLAFADEAADCRVLGEERRALILLLGFCGLRWGEAAALEPRDLDFDRGVLHVRRNLVYVNKDLGWVEGTPKSHERRDVPMPRIVMDALKPICERRDAGERVFRDAHGGPIRKQSLARTSGWWTRTLVRLGWGEDDWPVPHDLRHTAASLAVHAGANVKALQRMLGHKNASMTLDVYADLFDSDLMDVARMLDAAVQVETGGGTTSEECGQNVGKPASETVKTVETPVFPTVPETRASSRSSRTH